MKTTHQFKTILDAVKNISPETVNDQDEFLDALDEHLQSLQGTNMSLCELSDDNMSEIIDELENIFESNENLKDADWLFILSMSLYY